MTLIERDATRVVLDVPGLHWAAQSSVVQAVLRRRPGVRHGEANVVAQTATVTYDPAVTSVAELAGWLRACGAHCAGQSVPGHVCDPTSEPSATPTAPYGSHETTRHVAVAARPEDGGHGGPPRRRTPRWTTAVTPARCRWRTCPWRAWSATCATAS